jgi:hypothetical protein
MIRFIAEVTIYLSLLLSFVKWNAIKNQHEMGIETCFSSKHSLAL